MKSFFEKMETLLLRLAILVMVMLVTVQGVMTADPLRWYMSWAERMEGQLLEYPVSRTTYDFSQVEDTKAADLAAVTLGISPYSALPFSKILVNGIEQAVFEKSTVQLKVRGGDTIEIDSTYYNFPVEYQVISVSENVAFPKSGEKYYAHQSMVILGKTIVK